jgi:hypothetical protein
MSDISSSSSKVCWAGERAPSFRRLGGMDRVVSLPYAGGRKRVLEDEDSLPDEASGLGFQTGAVSEVGTTKDEDDLSFAFPSISSCTTKALEP